MKVVNVNGSDPEEQDWEMRLEGNPDVTTAERWDTSRGIAKEKGRAKAKVETEARDTPKAKATRGKVQANQEEPREDLRENRKDGVPRRVLDVWSNRDRCR